MTAHITHKRLYRARGGVDSECAVKDHVGLDAIRYNNNLPPYKRKSVGSSPTGPTIK